MLIISGWVPPCISFPASRVSSSPFHHPSLHLCFRPPPSLSSRASRFDDLKSRFDNKSRFDYSWYDDMNQLYICFMFIFGACLFGTLISQVKLLALSAWLFRIFLLYFAACKPLPLFCLICLPVFRFNLIQPVAFMLSQINDILMTISRDGRELSDHTDSYSAFMNHFRWVTKWQQCNSRIEGNL